MKTYSKDDVISTIRDLLEDVTEVESIEHVGGNELFGPHYYHQSR